MVDVMRKSDEDWVKKCMEYRVGGRRLVGRSRKPWLESVKADMAELEIDKEDVHDRSKCECYEEEVQPYRKTDYKPLIYIPSMEDLVIRKDRTSFEDAN